MCLGVPKKYFMDLVLDSLKVWALRNNLQEIQTVLDNRNPCLMKGYYDTIS